MTIRNNAIASQFERIKAEESAKLSKRQILDNLELKAINNVDSIKDEYLEDTTFVEILRIFLANVIGWTARDDVKVGGYWIDIGSLWNLYKSGNEGVISFIVKHPGALCCESQIKIIRYLLSFDYCEDIDITLTEEDMENLPELQALLKAIDAYKEDELLGI